MPVLVGTSGWQYRHWRGAFYPPDVAQRQWLEYYASRFGAVENNGTFYRLPAPGTAGQWRDRTPDGFVMAVKASRYLSHVKRLHDPAEPVQRMLSVLGGADGLGRKLGPVLLQTPPDLAADVALLDDCLAQFPPGLRVAVEPRHPSWWSDRVRAVLTARNAALCWADRGGQPVTPRWITADWGYLRFHEGTASPWPRYGEDALAAWADLITRTWPAGATVHAYFNNDQNAAAVADAAALARLTSSGNR